ncbi:MAG: HAD family hydrolase [Planctomycetota bacterium]|jgi:putative hydrolase of the HAD superfamily
MAEARDQIRAVVFDLDDTLYAERDYVRSGYRAVAERLENCPAGGGEADADIYQRWLWQRFLRGKSEAAFDALNDHWRLGLTAEQIRQLVDTYRGHRPDIRPTDGVAEMLGHLHPRFGLALLTDGYLPAQHLKLEALKLRRFFDVTVFTEEFGRACWKPSAAGYEMAQQRLGLPHEALAYVGDNPAKDFVAPNELGWLSVQFLRPGQIHARRPAPPGGEPKVVVCSPGELHKALLGGI